MEFRANNSFHKQKKMLLIKEYCFRQTEILTPQARMKYSLRRYVSKTRKSCFHWQEYLKKHAKTGFQQQERGYSNKNAHQQKKASNKSTKFVLNEKSVSTSQNAGFLEKYHSTGPKSYFHLNQYLKKIKENCFFYQKQDFLKILVSL